jgi:hypothetical protein
MKPPVVRPADNGSARSMVKGVQEAMIVPDAKMAARRRKRDHRHLSPVKFGRKMSEFFTQSGWNAECGMWNGE